jgi:hypothetical protein
MIRVGRRKYAPNGTFVDPSYFDYTPILCLTKSSPFGDIGPYVLADDQGRIMENIWQFSKVYTNVPAVKLFESRYNKKVIWQHPAEIHVEADEPNAKYWAWRQKGMTAIYPIRYPVGFSNRQNCLYALKENPDGTISEPMDYVQARKSIYVPVYCSMVKTHPKFIDLKKRAESGEKLLIIEVDGPHQESMEYYKQTYGVPNSFIIKNTIGVTEHSMQIMLNDPKHPFGHGYCLAMALLDADVEWNY